MYIQLTADAIILSSKLKMLFRITITEIPLHDSNQVSILIMVILIIRYLYKFLFISVHQKLNLVLPKVIFINRFNVFYNFIYVFPSE